MNKILHITPHFGGGVGKVLRALAASDQNNHHTFLSLDYANDETLKWAEQESITVFSAKWAFEEFMASAIENADILLIHFWNHPLLYHILINYKFPPARVALWSHVSGLHAPYVFPKRLLAYPDHFAFTTEASLASVKTDERFSHILSTGGVADSLRLSPIEHKNFTVGYIGTVDFAKMHPDYVAVHREIEGARFLIVGGDNEKHIAQDADARFCFTGKVPTIAPYLAQMDVFGYLLCPKHYGTAEQALQEAMAAGVVPVVLDNAAEKHLVRHGETGLVASSLSEYQSYIRQLMHDRPLLNKLAAQGKAYAARHFSLSNMVAKWQEVFSILLAQEKKEHDYGLQPLTPYELFLESVGEEAVKLFRQSTAEELGALLRNHQWNSNSKGTPKQYLQFFPHDVNLQRLCSL